MNTKTDEALHGESERSKERWLDVGRTLLIPFTALVPMIFAILVFAMAHNTDEITTVAPMIASLIFGILWCGGYLAYGIIRWKLAENKTLLNQILNQMKD